MIHNRDKNIFNQYDVNGDGYLSVCELKKLVERCPEQCKDLPRGVTDFLHAFHDENGDGRLDFEEFYKLSRRNHWVVRDWCAKYCEYIIPPRCASKCAQKIVLPVAANMNVFDQVDFNPIGEIGFNPGKYSSRRHL